VCLFEKNVVEWDEDLLINGRASLETLVRVGMGIGRLCGSPAPLVNIGRNGSG
jgi:phosphatidylserine decarboxylase